MKFQDKIDSYLFKELSFDEVTAFERQLASDEELAIEVKKRETILLGLQAFGNQKMRDQIKRVRAEMLENNKEKSSIPSPQSKITPLKWLALAAVLISLLFLVRHAFVSKSSIEEKLFTEYFEPYSASFTTRNNNIAKEKIEARDFYNKKDYNSAIPLLENILSKQPYNADIELALASSYLAIGSLDHAVSHCTQVIERKDELYLDQAHWYIALAYIQQSKISQGRTHLQKLANDSRADFHIRAKELLSDLE